MRKYIIALVLGIVLFIGVNNYFGWYAYKKWECRKETRGDLKESIKRKVFIKKLNFIIEPDSLMKNYNLKDTVFYIEKGYYYGYHSMEDTRLTNVKTEKYPYQVCFSSIEIAYLKKNNLKNNDSILYALPEKEWGCYAILIKKPFIDTIYFRLLSYKTDNVVDPKLVDTIGVVKVFD